VTKDDEEKKSFLEENLIFIAIIAGLVFIISLIIAITCCVVKSINTKSKDTPRGPMDGISTGEQD